MTLANAHTLSVELRRQVMLLLPVGRASAISGSRLAGGLGVSERTLRALIDDLIVQDGWLIGSTCSEPAGYFVCATEADVEAGTAHLLSRARSLWTRVAALRRAATETFGERHEVLTLFDDLIGTERTFHDTGERSATEGVHQT